ncbi:hypothetical protein PIB30_035565 [Stylosanthes scabra]|uniref:F-box associated beta-propeller type 1 domain-containing protein n=1 Tax=Stylosanthes scabra TaxID=79078 RepID=A0ABU6TF11_9FABA|nr:hypothetical protein [Stylosanthes scabra]
MSDPPPRNFDLPHIEDDLLWKILVKAEPKVAARCQLLSTAWNFKLQSSLFLMENFHANRNRTRSLIIGMGHPPTDNVSHYFVRYDVDRNEQLTIVVPISIWRYQNHSVVGSDHGVICIRSSAGGGRSRIFLWNPLTSKDQLLPDDPHGHCSFSTSVYGFGYLVDSKEHKIVHIFKCDHTDKNFRWSLYDSFGKGWNNKGVINSAIEKLDPKSVVLNGCVHWLGWVGVLQLEPSHIGIFDMQKMKWFEAEIPEGVKKTYHTLVAYNNGVGFVSYQNCGLRRNIHIWQLVQQGGVGINWVKMINVGTLAIPLSPTVFIDNDIISVLECRGGFAAANDANTIDLLITILKRNAISVRQLLHNSWQEELCLKTKTMHSESLYDPRT